MRVILLLSNGKANDALAICNEMHIKVMFAQTSDFALRLCDQLTITAVIVDEPTRQARLIKRLHARYLPTRTILFDGDSEQLKSGLKEIQAAFITAPTPEGDAGERIAAQPVDLRQGAG